MEGHPRYENPGATGAPSRVDSRDAHRKRAFLLLDGERRSLTAQVRPSWRRRSRYEDLSLVLMLARLERDCLSQPRPQPEGGGEPKGHRDQPGHRLADWASPWGAAPRMKLDADIGRVDSALKRLGRWLSRRAVAKARSRAGLRLEAIAAGLEGWVPQARAAAAGTQGAATKTRGIDRPTLTRFAAVAGLFLLAAGAGAFLVATHMGGGPGDSVDRRGAVAGAGQHPGAFEAQIQRRSPDKGRRAGHRGSQPDNPKPPASAGARSQGAGQSAPAATEVAAPAIEPAPAPQPAAAPAPAPPSSPASSTPSQAKSPGGGGGCPPEFGYEC
jgi:hypothetical protein